MIGERALYLNRKYPDQSNKWKEFTINQTYLDLIIEFPEEYKSLDGADVCKNNVQCDICDNVWYALYFEDTKQLQCPNCKQMAYHEVINGC